MAKQKIQNYLHELIKNLSQTEKRYFKLLAKQQTPGKKNDYIKLFEAIDKQKEFDEEKIKAQFRGTPIEKRYASLKKYLYELVIKSLTFYNSETISSVKVRRMLDAAEILQRKGLYHQAIRKLDKAEKMAEEIGMNFVIHDITRLKVSCKSMIGELPSEEEFNAFKEKQNQLIERMVQTNHIFNKSLDTVFYAMYTRDDTSVFNKEGFAKIINEDFIELENQLDGGYNKHTYYKLMRRYYSVLEDKEQTFAYTQKHIDLFESGEMQIKHMPSNYIHSLMNVVENMNPKTQKEEIDFWINKCEQFFLKEGNSYYNRSNDRGHLYCIQQTHAMVGGYDLEADQITEEVTEYLALNASKMNKFAVRWLSYNNAWQMIKHKNYKGALKLSNELLNDDDISKSHFLYSPSVIQNIIIHFELKNFSYLEFAIGSFYKELKKKCQLTSSESLVFDFFYQNLSKVGSSALSNREMFFTLMTRFEATAKLPLDFSSEYLLQWIKNKSGNKIYVNEEGSLQMG